jgi:peptidoglycan/LPS O-acetylase OafA/YrhL
MACRVFSAGARPLIMTSRIKSLDALRGLAALAVVVHHCLMAFPLPLALQHNQLEPSALPLPVLLVSYSPLHVLWSGTEAVVFFFVLSGFVLSLPLLSGRTMPYLEFVAKRFCRIYIPFLVVATLSIVLLGIVSPGPVDGLSPWFHAQWDRPLSAGDILQVVLLTPIETPSVLVRVLNTSWSLVHEWRVSLLFPLLVPLLARLRPLTAVLAAAAVASIALNLAGRTEGLPGALVSTLFYAQFFVFGVVLAQYRHALTAKLRGRVRRVAAWAACAVLLGWTWLPPFINLGFLQSELVTSWAIAAGAVLGMALLLTSDSARRLLEGSCLQRLGAVSYSLYLVHPVVLLSLLRSPLGAVCAPAAALAVLPLSLLLAAVTYRFIEQPSIALGRRLTHWLATQHQGNTRQHKRELTVRQLASEVA